MSDPNKAVFLSYASQDAEAAKKICEALRAAGVEVWFDQSELVGGDAWDAKIRGQISSCALFMPVISASTQARLEGYFRVEWKIAARRTHAMATAKAFLLPLVIDDTKDAAAHVPDEFRDVQWTKLPGGEVPPAFAARVQKLLGGSELEAGRPRPATARGEGAPAPTHNRGVSPPSWIAYAGLAVGALLIAAGATWFILKPKRSPEEIAKLMGQAQTVAANAAKAAAPRSPSDATLERVRATLRKIDPSRVELDLAVELLTQAAKADPTNARIFAAWATTDCRYLSAYYDVTPARREAASRHIGQATALDASDPEVRLARAAAMGLLNTGSDTHTERLTLLEGVLRDLPGDPRVLGEMGWAASDISVAESWWDQQARVPGWRATAQFNRGLRNAYSKRYREAYAALSEASALDRAPNIRLWKAYLEVIWLGDVTKARQTTAELPAEAFIEDMPASARFFVAYWSRDYQAALTGLQAIPRDFMESAAYYGPTGSYRGDALAKLGRPTAAENEWRAALAVTERRLAAEPNDAYALLNKALLLVALGRKAEAELAAKTARELGVDNGNWLDDYVAAVLLPPDEMIARLEQQIRARRTWHTAAVLRLNPYYDHLRTNPRFIALQAEADADPRLSPTAVGSENGKQNTDDRILTPHTADLVSDNKSVAVLAFANLSDDKGNEYFSDGVSEELLNVLAKVPGLKVTARTSSFHFKGTNTAIPEIAQQLGVAYVVEGSVRKQGDKVRITAQLIKAADGFHVWSDTFTRDLKDIFAVQDEIAGLIAQNLELKLGLKSHPPAVGENPEVNRLYLEALAAWNQRTPESIVRAHDLLLQALDLAPGFARAKALLSQSVSLGAMDDLPGMTAQRALQLADEALALDPMLAAAHAARGAALGRSVDARRDAVIGELRRAIELDPNYATGHQWLGRELTASGRMAEALASLRRAAELDPLSHRILDNYAQAQAWSGDLPGAMATLDRALKLQPASVQARQFRASYLLRLGRVDEAAALLADPMVARFLPHIHVQVLLATNRPLEAQALLASVRNDFERGLVLCALGRGAEGWPFLKPSMTLHLEFILWEVAELLPRNDPAFRQALDDWGLTEAWQRAEAWRAAHPVAKPRGVL